MCYRHQCANILGFTAIAKPLVTGGSATYYLQCGQVHKLSMAWARYFVILCHSQIVIYGHIAGKGYWATLEDHIRPVVQALQPEGGAIYQVDDPICRARSQLEWLSRHKCDVEHVSWPVQSPGLIFGLLCISA